MAVKAVKQNTNSCGLKEHISKSAVAQLFGIGARRLEQLVQDGVVDNIKINGRAVFETVPTIQKYIKYLSDKAYGRERVETEASLKEQKLRAEVALKESQGELHRLRTEIAAGKYISVEEVKADYSRFFIVFKNFATSIPSKMAGRLQGFIDPAEVREIEHELQKEVKALLGGFVLKAMIEKEPVREEKEKKRGRPRKNAKK